MSELVPIVTPVGELHYVHISGQGKLNYNEDGYNYVATLYLEGEKAQKVITQLEEVLGDVPKGKNVKSKGYRELLKDADGTYEPTSNTTERDAKAVETGIYAFRFSTSTTFADGKQKKISVYNSANPPSRINLGERKIGNGSKGAISGKLQRYEKGKDVGVSLFLNAVQLVEFIEYVGDAGFEGQEGGFIGDGEGFDPSVSEASVEETSPTTNTGKQKAKPKL
ncbi:MAG: hypothetical protein EOM35_02355 [Negativicutes bacterium]|nr:hypothetical protein [Negativicutes bacterium]